MAMTKREIRVFESLMGHLFWARRAITCNGSTQEPNRCHPVAISHCLSLRRRHIMQFHRHLLLSDKRQETFARLACIRLDSSTSDAREHSASGPQDLRSRQHTLLPRSGEIDKRPRRGERAGGRRARQGGDGWWRLLGLGGRRKTRKDEVNDA